MFDLDTPKVVEPLDDFDYKKHIVSNDEINKEVEDIVLGKIKKGFGIGFPVLDNHIVAKSNEFFALVGKKGRGKTTIQQILQLMWSIVNNLIWVVAYQENDDSDSKLNYLGYLLCDNPKSVKRNNPELYYKAMNWLDKYFIFINVRSIKTATDVVKGLKKDGVNVHGLVIDPVNSFRNGWSDTGNKYMDGEIAATELLFFSKEVCSIHLSQHPNMAGQRSNEDINSFHAEGGWFLNKASFTYAINRDNGSNENRISVDNVRKKRTGGGETSSDNPIKLHFSPSKIDLEIEGSHYVENVILELKKKHNPLGEKLSLDPLPTVNPSDAFELPNDIGL